MKLDRFLRISIGLIVLLVFIIAIAALLFMTESALNVWDRLVQGPRIILYGYLAMMLALAVTAIWLVVRLVVRRKPAPAKKTKRPLDKAEILNRLREAEEAGVKTDAAQAELRELAARQETGSVHLCFFGEIRREKALSSKR